MTYVLIWFFLAICTAVVASNKGRSGILWGVFGFLLGPIALLLALVTSKDTKQLDRQAVKSGGMKKCHYCAELIRSEAVTCRFCGRDCVAPEKPKASTHTIGAPKDPWLAMAEHGITFDGERYHFGQYRYEKLEDAVRYAESQKH